MGVKPAPKITDAEKQQLNSELLPVMQNVQVYKDTFDLLVFAYRTSAGMNREYRFTLGEEMKRTLQHLLTAIYEARKQQPPRATQLEKALHWCYEAKVLYRAMDELGLLKNWKCAVYIQYLASISKQLTAWYKYEQKHEKKETPATGT